MLQFLEANHGPPLLHMTKRFIWIYEKKRIIEFAIGDRFNSSLNINKSFRDQVQKCMYTIFGEITQPFIKVTLSKKEYKCVNINNVL